MAVFAFCQHRLGRTDGVSLEVDKWRRVLEGMGHTVHYIAGNDDVPGGHFIPELFPFHPVTNKLIKNCTVALSDYANEAELEAAIRTHADRIKPQMVKFIRDLHVDVLLPNNLLSVGYNLAGMLALSEAIRETGVRGIVHSHDFWWEDSGEVNPTCKSVIRLYLQHAPPAYPQLRHVVINRLAQSALKTYRGLDATVVPNVFDFDQPAWKRDDYNADFRRNIGVGEDDLVFLQATRILDRKAVELAIDVVAELNKPGNRRQLESATLYNGKRFTASGKIVLVCAGYVEGIGLSGHYHAHLIARAQDKGVDVRWVGDIVKHSRGTEAGKKVYSLWDSYVHADFVTYPSVWEGWGNQFIEALFAKLPVVLFEYPVYVTDLKQHGFDVVSLGDKIAGKDKYGLVTVEPRVLENAARQVIRLLQDKKARQETVKHNFRIAAEHFSMQALERIIRSLLKACGI
jgi:glycosyltransferase involved in cell wall biosynthesis